LSKAIASVTDDLVVLISGVGAVCTTFTKLWAKNGSTVYCLLWLSQQAEELQEAIAQSKTKC